MAQPAAICMMQIQRMSDKMTMALAALDQPEHLAVVEAYQRPCASQ